MIFREIGKKAGVKDYVKSIAIIIGLLGVATAVSEVFFQFNIAEANSIMVYMLAVTGIAYATKGFWPSFLASFMAVLIFNYLFTEPRFSFAFVKTSYAFTFIFMFVSAMMMSTMTNKMQAAMLLAKSRERRTQLLFHVSQRLIRIESKEDVASVIGEECSSILHRRILVATSTNGRELDNYLYFQKGKRLEHFPPLAAHHFSSMNGVFSRHLTEQVTPKFKGDANVFYVPVKGKRMNYGIIGFILKDDEEINSEHQELGMAIAAMMSNAFEHYAKETAPQ